MKNYCSGSMLNWTILMVMVIFSFSNSLCAVEEKMTAAVLDFEAGEGVSKGTAMTLSDYLRTQLVNSGKFNLVNRENVESILKEQKFQMTGFTEKDVAQAGKLLGVNKVFVGSLGKVGSTYLVNLKIVDVQSGRIERAETEECESENQLLAGVRNLVNKMIGLPTQPIPKVAEAPKPAPAPAPPPPPAYTYTPPKQYLQVSAPAGKNYSFIDVLVGYSLSTTMDLKFKRSTNMYAHWIGITLNNNANYVLGSISWKNLKTSGTIPFGLRIGGFFNSVLGADVEFSYESHNIVPQSVKCTVDGNPNWTFNFTTSDYLTVKSIPIWIDLLIRAPLDVVEPYFGAGFGFSLNFIDGPTLKGYTKSSTFSAPTYEMELGFGVRFPFGLRIHLGNNTSIFVEGRYQINEVSFDRDIKNENDSVSTKSLQFLCGIGSLF
ncbi:hypothetical protein AUJ66_08320 [Candidatus Desantisbacteria bacterium CG1_02_38_46]|uniref:Outer membrane protein beta-barrel domain-containing protein n=2 Tax=unclassified Candidatus Desantisiibacteriota TaxID=3106372 RepID=A0A2H9PC74_9BACT|nr:MAG: hypothetical protein AUJ66_08320 [Candidatus Desantisbacteria bacterium CG1_02_38_46]PIZ16626.1 MAG: hypothetical protein COY51_02230 [Candidatus Desantisbacteria bacterium CG_4_10_14_0_8_um_filter_39_17]